MENAEDYLRGKHLLIVDDEPDILDTLEEMLDMCIIDSAPDYDAAKKFLDKTVYDAAILDIMGVRGYDLLDLCIDKGIPALMLTAHALSPDNLKKSIQSGASAYIPKDKIADIAEHVADLLQNARAGKARHGGWFAKLRPFFDRKFGPGWKEEDRDFWEEYEKKYVPKREDAEKLL